MTLWEALGYVILLTVVLMAWATFGISTTDTILFVSFFTLILNKKRGDR